MKIQIGAKKEIAIQASDQTKAANLAEVVSKQVTGFSADQLEKILHKTFPPQEINKLLLDMTRAEDTKSTAQGDFYNTPNWDARDKALTKILRLLRYIQNNEGTVSDQPPTSIVFNVIQKQVNIDKQQVNNSVPTD